jgi:predicted alpha/beta hydrolase family esterase
MSRLLLVPRWSGNADSDFYPWLRESLRRDDERVPDTVHTVDLRPSQDAPRIEESIVAFREVAASAEEPFFVLAHSVGCQVCLRGLARYPELPVRGVLLVAPWFDIDEPWESIRPWCEESFDLSISRARTRPIHALLSDNDPFTADSEKTRTRLVEELDARVTIIPGARHFNEAEEPDVLHELQALMRGAC